MTEGGMIKMYVEKEHINQSDVAAAVGVPENELHTIYESQTVAPDIKKKLQDLFNRNIFDGTLLMEQHKNTPDPESKPVLISKRLLMHTLKIESKNR